MRDVREQLARMHAAATRSHYVCRAHYNRVNWRGKGCTNCADIQPRRRKRRTHETGQPAATHEIG